MGETLYIAMSDGQTAPHPEEHVRHWWSQGSLPPQTLYWKEGMAEWRPLAELLGPSPAAPPAPSPTHAYTSPTTYSPTPYPTQASPYSSSYPAQTFQKPALFFDKDPVSLTNILKAMLGIYLVLSVLSLGSDWMQYQLLNSGSLSNESIAANDARQQGLAILTLLCYVVTVIVFGMWIYRANRNVRGFGATGLTFTPGWSVGYYFIPFINLVRPYQAMQEIWQASSNPHRWASEPSSPLLGVWWALWITASVLGQMVFRMSRNATSVESLQTSTLVSMFSSLADIGLTIAAISLVSQIIAMQLRVVGRNA
jgi:hypothetical protein